MANKTGLSLTYGWRLKSGGKCEHCEKFKTKHPVDLCRDTWEYLDTCTSVKYCSLGTHQRCKPASPQAGGVWRTEPRLVQNLSQITLSNTLFIIPLSKSPSFLFLIAPLAYINIRFLVVRRLTTRRRSGNIFCRHNPSNQSPENIYFSVVVLGAAFRGEP